MPILRHIDFNPPNWGEFGGTPPQIDRSHHHAMFADRPLAYWPLDDTSGSLLLLDAQRGVHHATVVGVVTPGAGGGPLIHEPITSTEFNGGRLELPTLASFGSKLPGGFTFGCWLRVSTTQSAMLISAVDPLPGVGWMLQVNTNRLGQTAPGYVRCFLRDIDSHHLRADAYTADQILDGEWHHLAITYDPGGVEVRFFLDGQSLSTNYGDRNTPLNTSAFSVPLVIGARSLASGFSDPYIGGLSHISLFDRPLPPSAIAAHHQAGVGPAATTLSQTTAAAYPDSPGGPPLGLRGSIGPGNAGVSRSITTASPTDPTHTRITIRPGSLSTGSGTVLRAIDGSERPVAWIRLANDQTVTLHTNDQASVPVELPNALPWHSLELVTYAASATAKLYINGQLAATLATLAGEGVVRIDVGVMDCRDASGTIDLDEWVVADTDIGPPIAIPRSDHADDPARWLVIYRRDQPDSAAWANAYRLARHIPLGHLLGLTTADDEVIGTSAYHQFRSEIDARLAQGSLADQLIGVILGPGLPGLVDVHGDATRAWPVMAGLQAGTDVTQLTLNPLGDGPLQRPTAASLEGRLLVARIDGDATTSNELITRSQSISSTSLSNDSSAPGLYIDSFGDPANDNTNNDSLADWAQSIKAQSLRLTVRTTSRDERSFTELVHDAVYFGYEDGAPTAALFGPSSSRAIFVQAGFLQPPWQTLRTARSSHWPGLALDAGYAATIAATSTYSPSHAIRVDRFFAALSAGWTLAEAWHVAQPVLGTPFHLIGDPLMTVQFPRAGFRAYGPATSAQQALAEPPTAVIDSASTDWHLSIDPATSGGTGVFVLASLDESNRENRAIDAIQLISPTDSYRVAPLGVIWPRRTSWPLAQGRIARIVWDRPPVGCGIARVQLERDELGAQPQTEADVDASSVRAHHLDFIPAPPTSRTRWRWLALDETGAAYATPWSAWITPRDVPSAGPPLEPNS